MAYALQPVSCFTQKRRKVHFKNALKFKLKLHYLFNFYQRNLKFIAKVKFLERNLLRFYRTSVCLTLHSGGSFQGLSFAVRGAFG